MLPQMRWIDWCWAAQGFAAADVLAALTKGPLSRAELLTRACVYAAPLVIALLVVAVRRHVAR